MSPVQPQGQMSPVQTQGTPANQAINNMLATPATANKTATTSTQPQMSPVQPQGQMSPVQTQGTPANQAINNMLATPATPPTGNAALNPTGTNQDTAIPSGQAAPAPAGTKFPTTPAEIKAFQKAHGLKDDGLIGPNTLTALAKAGIQPPAGFKMAGAKQHPAPHPAQQGAAAKPAQHGAAAKPAAAAPGTVGYVDPKTGAVSSGDAERDERMAQFGQVAQMTPAQQQMFNQGAADQDAAAAGTAETGRPGTKADLDQMYKAFGNQTAPATNKAPVGGQIQSTGDPVKDSELSKQGNTIVYKESQELARILQLARG
jgi:hypothetical protein